MPNNKEMSETEVLRAIFGDRYPEDETPDYETWSCSKCHKEFIDPEDFSFPHVAKDIPREPRLYWLSITEPLCENCAAIVGVPPLDWS
jgi:hypothetical protein